jgi:N-acetylneuraminic acid mutarotase
MSQRLSNKVWSLRATAADAVSSLPEFMFDSAASSDEKISVVCGGVNENGTVSDFAAIIRQDLRVERIRPLPERRARHAMAALGDGRFLAVGGITQHEDFSLSLARTILSYSTRTDKWDVWSELPRRSSLLVAERVGSTLYVIAGDTGTSTQPGRPISPARCRGDVQICDVSTRKWSSGVDKPHPETGVTSAVLGDEIFVVSSTDANGKVNALVEVYNTTTNTWRRVHDMPTPRTSVPCGFVGGKLYCVGGQGADLNPTSAFEVYDPKSDHWQIVNSKIEPIAASAHTVHDGALILLGGWNSSGG